MKLSDFPVLLNGRSAEGRIVFLDADGSAWVDVPSPVPGPPGSWPGTTRAVPRPPHMDDPVFLANPGAVLWASADGSRAIAVPLFGNPPLPPRLLPEPPACARELAGEPR